jgi:hypothetical protein
VKKGFLSALSADQLNYLNIGLMFVAAIAAFIRPFELFLFAYAFLGPLHYLTEISWLHDRKYFTKGKNDYLFLVGIAAIIAIIDLQIFGKLPMTLSIAVTYVGFVAALVFVLVRKTGTRLVCFGALLLSTPLVIRNDFLQSVFLLLLPTIVHVFIFTGLFILVGALRGRSISGIASLVVFCLCAISFFVFAPAHAAGPLGEYVRTTYKEFAQLNYALMTPFNRHDLTVPANASQYAEYVNNVLFHSPTALAVMGFIAFAYAYHYLNWFSKTSIIQWHNIPRSRLIAVIVIWIASIAAYAYDYKFGLRWLYFLAFTHVLLEFPLNHLTIINIGKEFKTMVGRTRGGELKPALLPVQESADS